MGREALPRRQSTILVQGEASRAGEAAGKASRGSAVTGRGQPAAVHGWVCHTVNACAVTSLAIRCRGFPGVVRVGPGANPDRGGASMPEQLIPSLLPRGANANNREYSPYC